MLLDVQLLLHVIQIDGQQAADPLLLRRRKVRFTRDSRRRESLARSLAPPLPTRPAPLGSGGGPMQEPGTCYLMCSSFSTSFRLMVSRRLIPCSCMVTP